MLSERKPKLDLDALEKVARGVPAVPWETTDDQCVREPDWGVIVADFSCHGRGEWENYAAYHQAFDPPTVLALLDAARAEGGGGDKGASRITGDDLCADRGPNPGLTAGAVSPVCERGCATFDDCGGLCNEDPPWLRDMPTDELDPLLDFANEVQSWSFGREGDTTFGEAAEHFKVPVEQISRAVVAHYWLFTLDTDKPLAERRIEHEGE